MPSSRIVPLALAAAGMLMAGCAATAPPIETARAPLAANSFVVRNVRVFDGQRGIERVNVVVRDGRIASVGRETPPASLPMIDGSGRTLVPGLINSHGHALTDAQLRNSLRFGVTTLLDMFTRVEFMQSHRVNVAQFNRSDLADMYSAGNPATSPGGMGTQFGLPFATIAGPQEAAAFVRARRAEGSSYIKILYEPGVDIVTSISLPTLRAAVAAARAEGLLSVVHVSSLEGARGAFTAGADGLAHGFSDALIDPLLARQMAARGMFVIPTLSISAALAGQGTGPGLAVDSRISPYLTAGQRTALNQPGPGNNDPMAGYLARHNIQRALENVRRLRAAGVRILAGDDSPNLGTHGASMHGELELLTRAGLTPAQALHAATRATADAFRLPDRGRIEPGARADFIIVDGNPLADIRATRAIVRVFKNGYDVARAPPPPVAAARPQ
jgi:imidazolonepropionase-like amidohydrolase